MISLIAVLILLGSHWLFDFVFQTSWQAQNKSTNISALMQHVTCYSASWAMLGVAVCLLGFISPLAVIAFTAVTFLAHGITDYFTSRLNSYLWKKNDVHNFFVSVGFDQLLHFIQLLVTYQIVSTWK